LSRHKILSRAAVRNIDLAQARPAFTAACAAGTLLFHPSSMENNVGRESTNMRAVEQVGLDDVTVRAMGQAFDIACSRLIRAGVLDASNVERMQQLAAKHLVHCARRGERDEWRLARRAIFTMCMAAANERLAAEGTVLLSEAV
jgi:hypothetical protein